MNNKTMIMSNFDPLADEVIYTNDRGSWNVSRALRDCKAGKHKIYKLDVAEAYEANKACEVDEAKVKRFMRTPEVFKNPGIGIIEDGAMWFIEGHHRLRALHRLSIADFYAYIIEEADAAPYQVWYNGKRTPPFKPY